KCFRCLVVDSQVELGRLLHGQVGGPSALQNLVHVTGTTTEQIGQARAVRQESPRNNIFPDLIHRRQAATGQETGYTTGREPVQGGATAGRRGAGGASCPQPKRSRRDRRRRANPPRKASQRPRPSPQLSTPQGRRLAWRYLDSREKPRARSRETPA